PAPPVLEFDTEGNLTQGWGGPSTDYGWVGREHGISVDTKQNVWITGSDHVVAKFTRTGKFLLQIGVKGRTNGSDDTKLLGAPTEVAVDPNADEVFVADGYLNTRVIVFDANTGAYKRHWGAYGKTPDDSVLGRPELRKQAVGGPPYKPDDPPAQQFDNSVHSI